jgi:hypothetical protein
MINRASRDSSIATVSVTPGTRTFAGKAGLTVAFHVREQDALGGAGGDLGEEFGRGVTLEDEGPGDRGLDQGIEGLHRRHQVGEYALLGVLDLEDREWTVGPSLVRARHTL